MIQTHWAAGPTKFPGELCIGLLRGSHSASDFKAQIGNLMRLSPEEFDHSLLIHIGDRIQAGAEQHELEQRVRRLAEDSRRDYTIQVFDSMDDALFHSINDRSYYTKEHNKKLTLSELADLWTAKAGMKVYDRLLKEPELYEIIMDLQNRYSKNSCLNSIKNLEAISTKGKTMEERLWILRCVQDYLLSGTSNNEFGSRLMMANKSGGGPAGMLDMFLCKLQMRDYFVDRWCSDKGFDGKSLSLLRDLKSHSSFRERCGGGWAEGSTDVSWQGCRMEAER
ncbi:unnamed protein product, partial [Symbiodinium necroappetens]